jgi:hypothetical protein
VAAAGDEREDDVVTGAEVGNTGADLLHHPGALVAAHHREGEGDVAGDDVVVGQAQPGGGQLDQHLALAGRVEVDLLHAPLLAQPPENPGLRLHWSVLPSIMAL